MGDCPDFFVSHSENITNNSMVHCISTITYFTPFTFKHFKPPYDPNDDYQKNVHGLLGGMGFPGVNRQNILPYRSVHCKLCVTVNTKAGGS